MLAEGRSVAKDTDRAILFFRKVAHSPCDRPRPWGDEPPPPPLGGLPLKAAVSMNGCFLLQAAEADDEEAIRYLAIFDKPLSERMGELRMEVTDLL